MNLQLMGAVENRDGEALAKMAGGSYQPDKVLNSEAEGLVDSLFRQLKQIFPASTQTNLRTDADEKTAKRQWIDRRFSVGTLYWLRLLHCRLPVQHSASEQRR